ncbi:uncharacterized protein LOC122334847 isoform X2 [Puntigrus tetrazona]|uniref:uncharacterized protein LOC122334847 isoform X2 n=1 Tax=Puntigrus tetrazona TaxID=1606681 RepID=UPI001C8AC45C|nr:uncharacterized protein LOC122334847 isoform X2 [Puntigrus tetrazona]
MDIIGKLHVFQIAKICMQTSTFWDIWGERFVSMILIFTRVCRRCRGVTTVRKNTIFYQSRRSLQNHVEFIYRFSQGLRMRQIDLMEDGVASSSRTLSRMTAVLRKYNRGRFGSAWRRNKKWVLGILEVEQTRRKPILKVVRRRSKNELLPNILKYVRRGSSIITDEWRAYRRALTQAGYDHHTVCHKRNFVDPVTRAHTQHLERAWKTYKMDIWRHRGNRTTKLLKEHLKVIEWEYWLARNHPSHILGRLIHDIRKYNLHECS